MKLTGILAPTRDGSTVILKAARVLALANSDANHAGFFEYNITIVILELVVGIGQLTVTARLSRAQALLHSVQGLAVFSFFTGV